MRFNGSADALESRQDYHNDGEHMKLTDPIDTNLEIRMRLKRSTNRLNRIEQRKKRSKSQPTIITVK